MDEHKLFELKKKIEEDKVKLNRIEGSIESSLKALRAEYSVKTLDEAKSLLQEKKTEHAKLEAELEKGIAALQRLMAEKEGQAGE